MGEDVRSDIVLTLQEMGFDIEASHHEVADGQHEIDFKYADILTTADNVTSNNYHLVVRIISLQDLLGNYIKNDDTTKNIINKNLFIFSPRIVLKFYFWNCVNLIIGIKEFSSFEA